MKGLGPCFSRLRQAWLWLGLILSGIELRLSGSLSRYVTTAVGTQISYLTGTSTKKMLIKLASVEDKLKQLPTHFYMEREIKRSAHPSMVALGKLKQKERVKKYAKRLLTPLKVFPICFRLLNGLRKEVMSVDSTVVISALTKGTSLSTTSSKARRRSSPKDGWY